MTDNESILSGWGVYFLLWPRGKCVMLAWQHLTTANQRAVKRDDVRSIRIEQELACSIIAMRKLPVADPVGSDI